MKKTLAEEIRAPMDMSGRGNTMIISNQLNDANEAVKYFL